MAAPTVFEQYMLELINRARLTPQIEADRFGLALNQDLPPGTLTSDPKQPLAWNEQLMDAARDHSRWMLGADTFSHGGENGSTIGDRIEAAGYRIDSRTGGTWGENLAWNGSTDTVSQTDSMTTQHQGLFESSGHRTNLLNSEFREIGIGSLSGPFVQDGTSYNAVMTTQNFARTGSEVFVTGVIFEDQDGNNFYSIGEGRQNIRIDNGTLANTYFTGGYQLEANPGSDYQVNFSGNALAAAVSVTVAVGSENIKLDLMDGNHLRSSASIMLGDAAQAVTLLGLADISATGNPLDNRLQGNGGDNLLNGGAGTDTVMVAGNRNDFTLVQSGHQLIIIDKRGQEGRDTLIDVEYLQFADQRLGLEEEPTDTGSQDFVDFLYRRFYGRSGDEAGLEYWSAQLDEGNLTTTAVVESFFQATEFQNVVGPVARLYFAALDRIPDSDGLRFWVDNFRADQTLSALGEQFIASAEFKSRFGDNLDNRDLVGQFYQNVLDRRGEQAGVDFWTQALDNGLSRGAVLEGFSESPENIINSAGAIRITLLYEGLLNRAPSVRELTIDPDLAANLLIEQLLDDPEYAGPSLVPTALPEESWLNLAGANPVENDPYLSLL